MSTEDEVLNPPEYLGARLTTIRASGWSSCKGDSPTSLCILATGVCFESELPLTVEIYDGDIEEGERLGTVILETTDGLDAYALSIIIPRHSMHDLLTISTLGGGVRLMITTMKQRLGSGMNSHLRVADVKSFSFSMFDETVIATQPTIDS